MIKIISVNQKMENNKLKLPLVIGFFDGVHIGHSRLLKIKKFNLLTFKNVPSKNSEFLFNEKNRTYIHEQLKPQNIFILDLRKNNLTSKDFIQLLKNKIKPSQIIVGSNFKFGKDRKGDIRFLKKYFKVTNVNILKSISTSRIKSLIKNGKMNLAQKQLISKFSITNNVVHGKRHGHRLGFPTANIYSDDNVIKIKPGVYAGFTKFGNKTFASAIFI
jgi:riboflavin kinase/FMN adenylyltransferase